MRQPLDRQSVRLLRTISTSSYTQCLCCRLLCIVAYWTIHSTNTDQPRESAGNWVSHDERAQHASNACPNNASSTTTKVIVYNLWYCDREHSKTHTKHMRMLNHICYPAKRLKIVTYSRYPVPNVVNNYIYPMMFAGLQAYSLTWNTRNI